MPMKQRSRHEQVLFYLRIMQSPASTQTQIDAAAEQLEMIGRLLDAMEAKQLAMAVLERRL